MFPLKKEAWEKSKGEKELGPRHEDKKFISFISSENSRRNSPCSVVNHILFHLFPKEDTILMPFSFSCYIPLKNYDFLGDISES